jgi:hypothetical protein
MRTSIVAVLGLAGADGAVQRIGNPVVSRFLANDSQSG